MLQLPNRSISSYSSSSHTIPSIEDPGYDSNQEYAYTFSDNEAISSIEFDGEDLDEGGAKFADFPATILTSGNPPLTTGNIIHISLLPEYPSTSLEGVTYCIPIDLEKKTPEEVLEDALSFQYCRRSKGPAKPTACPFLGGAATRWRYGCTGVKCCEHLDTTLKTLSHTQVTAEIWDTIKNARCSLLRTEPDRKRRESASFYRATLDRFQAGVACVSQGPGCLPILRRAKAQTVTGMDQWYIGCASWKFETQLTEKHFFRRVTDKLSLEYLQELFLNGLPSYGTIEEACGVIEGTRTRLKNCDVDHPSGPGQLILLPCRVQYHIIIPTNIQTTPYYLFTSIGVHEHPPNPPTRPPERIAEEIVQLIRRMQDPGLTVSRFLRSPHINEFCRRHKVLSFEQVHASLSNMDRLRRWIYRQQLLNYPAGQDLAGVEFEMKRRHQDPTTAYIRHIHTDSLASIVFCFSKVQANHFIIQKTFQIDLSFKRITRGFRELILAYYNEEHQKIITLARMCVSRDSRRVYEKCFRIFFELIYKDTGREVKWKYLHGEGLIGVTVDMDGKQMSGLGYYLSSIDPESRPWQWQLQNVVRFCYVHFQRKLEKASFGIERGPYSVQTRMEALLTCKDYSEWRDLCNLLIENEDPSIGRWALHKRHINVAAGLNQNCSLISKPDWNELSKTSNAVEQAANKSYSYGKNLPLLVAIFMAQRIDNRDIEQFSAQDQFGIRHSNRSNALSKRYQEHMRRDKNKQRWEASAQQDSAEDIEDEDAILFQSSSGGFVNRNYVPRVRRSPSQASSRRSRSRSTESQTRTPGLPHQASQTSLKRQALNNNQDLQNKRLELENRAKEAEIRRLELENERLEMELERQRRQLR